MIIPLSQLEIFHVLAKSIFFRVAKLFFGFTLSYSPTTCGSSEYAVPSEKNRILLFSFLPKNRVLNHAG